ncbi:RNA polymerase sigma factor [Candidatus Vecturithrix granuli]|uniref:RNA polymerase sigma factor n=1 Tax=Vecturithrix granuli TaxID=1499967 RepID=A0A081CA00_VECG1|nr:RNA polymerase sigma factor [Candidatus Vecturithrix granuli]
MTIADNLKEHWKLFSHGNFSELVLSNESGNVKKAVQKEATQTQIPDEKLVEASQNGDMEAFEALINKYQRQIFNLIYQMTHNVDIVEDIGQDVFVAAFRAIKDFQARSSFFTWLYRIAINHCKNYLTSTNRTQDIEKLYRAEQETAESSDDYEKNPQSMLLAKEFVVQMEEAMETLPAEQRIVITLCEFQGFSYQEIAEILQCPVGTVRSRLARARATLQEYLHQYV